MKSLAESDVMTVKANVTDLPLASGTRSAAAIVNDTPLTCPPSGPDGTAALAKSLLVLTTTPVLCKSLLVLTATPVVLPAVAGPNVTPLSVTTCAPAAKLPSTRIEMKLLCTL